MSSGHVISACGRQNLSGIAEAPNRGVPFTLREVVQAENYEAVAKKLDDLLKKKEYQEFEVHGCDKKT